MMKQKNNRTAVRQWLRLALVIFILIQGVRFIVPLFRIENPPVINQVVWNSPETERIWRESCADCHSNETVFPFYSYIAPVGWLVAKDVNEGRAELNISEDAIIDVNEVLKAIKFDEMPLPIYLPLHPEAVLDSNERQVFVEGIQATFRDNG